MRPTRVRHHHQGSKYTWFCCHPSAQRPRWAGEEYSKSAERKHSKRENKRMLWVFPMVLFSSKPKLTGCWYRKELRRARLLRKRIDRILQRLVIVFSLAKLKITNKFVGRKEMSNGKLYTFTLFDHTHTHTLQMQTEQNFFSKLQAPCVT